VRELPSCGQRHRVKLQCILAETAEFVFDALLLRGVADQRHIAKHIEAVRDTLPKSARGSVDLVRGRVAPAILERFEASREVAILGHLAASGFPRLALTRSAQDDWRSEGASA